MNADELRRTARESAIAALASRLKIEDMELAARLYLAAENLAASHGILVGNVIMGITKMADVKGIQGDDAKVFIAALDIGMNAATVLQSKNSLEDMADKINAEMPGEPRNRLERRRGLYLEPPPWHKNYNDKRRG